MYSCCRCWNRPGVKQARLYVLYAVVCGGVGGHRGVGVELISLRRLSHVTGFAFLGLLSCDKLKRCPFMDGSINQCGRGLTNPLSGQQIHTHEHRKNTLRRCVRAIIDTPLLENETRVKSVKESRSESVL